MILTLQTELRPETPVSVPLLVAQIPHSYLEFNPYLRHDHILVEAIFSVPVQTGPGPTDAPLQWVSGPFPGGKAAGGVAFITHTDLAPRLKKE